MDATLDKVVRSPRLAARRRAVRSAQRRRRRRIGMAVILVAALGAGAVSLSRTLLFDLARIDVVGASTVDPQSVVDASGLRLGDDVLSIDLGEVAARIRRLPGVRDARVERDGGVAVRIVIEERTAAVVVRSGNRVWMLDEDGQPVPAGSEVPDGIPAIAVARAPGVGAVVPRGAASSVLAVWEAMPEQLRAEVAWFQVPDRGSIRARVGGAMVEFGTLDRIREKVSSLMLVRARAGEEGRRLRLVDVRVPERPAVRMS